MDNKPQQFLALGKKLRAELEAIRQALLSLRDDLHNQVEETNKANKAADEKQKARHEVVAETHLPEGVEVHKSAIDARQDKKHHRHSVFLQWLTLIALVFYAYFTYRIMKSTKDAADATSRAANAARDSAALTRRIIVGTDAALLEGSVYYDSAPDNPSGLFRINIRNTGKSIATHVTGTFTVSRKTLPALKAIDSQPVTVDMRQIANPGGQYNSGKDQIFQVRGFKLDAVLKLQETVRVEGAYTYDNGFDDVTPQSLCFQMKAILNPTLCAYQGAVFMSCDIIPYETSHMEYMERNCKKEQNQQH